MIRETVKNLKPYAWESSSASLADALGLEEKDILRFDMNTSPYRIPFQLPDNPVLSEYPDASYGRLLKSLAKYARVSENRFVVGAGADEIIDIIARTFLEKGDVALISTPTYSMFRISTEIAGGIAVEVPREKDYSINPEAIISKTRETKAKLIFICNPNSPTGNSVPSQVLKKIAENSDSILVVDEAYCEFYGKSTLGAISSFDNAIIVRTLSKAFGLAGIRVGYAIAPSRLVEAMNKVRPPNSVSALSLEIAEKALELLPIMRRNVLRIIKERKRLADELGKLGFYVYPSATNFLLVQTSPELAGRVYEGLLKRGMVVRDFSRGTLTKGCMRITVRSRQENASLLSELGKILAFDYDEVIFDVDGVLVDVSESYREAIRRTASELLGRKVSGAEVDRIKSLVGFNNDWDATFALVTGIKDSVKINRKSKTYSRIKATFQKIYLGEDEPGLIKNERLLVSGRTLEELKRNSIKLGIVTGRPREEALIALRPFLGKYFDERNVIALEDCEEEKPSPKPLLLLMSRMRVKSPIYIGDSPSDVSAANSARIPIVVVGRGAVGDFYLRDVNEICKLVVRK